jgi:hypothetical protein
VSRPRGAGRGGGLLFVALVGFLAYLVASSVGGVAGLVLAGALGAVALGLAVRVLRRR